MPKKFLLSRSDYQKLARAARRAQRIDQSEVCGALVLDRRNRLHLRFLKNQSDQPGRWEIFVKDLALIRSQARSNKRRYVGTFHSHPISEAEPGKADLADAPGNSLMLIYDVCGREAKLWRVIRRKGKVRANNLRLQIRAGI